MTANSTQGQHLTPIVELTEDCNLGCRYCYTGSAFLKPGKTKLINERFVASKPFLLDAFDQIVTYNSGASTLIIFHGGEPLLIEPQNWRGLLEASRSRHPALRFSVQTNGTMIDDDFCQVFKDFEVRVGVSLDGPAFLNDLTRPNKAGGSSFRAVWDGIEKLKDAGVGLGVLVTLTAANVAFMEEIYRFFAERGVPFSMRPIFGSAFADTSELGIPPDQYAQAFCRVFDLWFDDPNSDFSMISEFSTMMAQLAEPIEGWVSCSFTRACAEHFISFDLDGRVSPCNRFHGNEKFVYGNLRDEPLSALMGGRIPTALATRWEKLDKAECGSCDMKEFCYGGCPANVVAATGNYFARDIYCGAYKTIHAHVIGRMRATLAYEAAV